MRACQNVEQRGSGEKGQSGPRLFPARRSPGTFWPMPSRRLLPALCALALAGCSSSREQAGGDTERGGPSPLRTYEAQFVPSEQDPDSGALAARGAVETLPPADTSSAPGPAEMVPGFRV